MDITIRPLTSSDQALVYAMDTGIKEDYVLRILHHLLQHERVYGALYNNKLVGIASYTLFEGHFAVLGRLRTDISFRGKGVATGLLSFIMEKLKANPAIEWIGLTTLDDNIPVHRIANTLGLNHLVTYFSYRMNDKDLSELSNPEMSLWKEIVHLEHKKTYIKEWLPDPHDNPLGMFPYECYYPLVLDHRLLTDEYITSCRMFVHEVKSRFVLLMPDDKGEHYLHAKYFWKDVFLDKGLIQLLKKVAKDENRILWLDSTEDIHNQPIDLFFSNRESWRLYGAFV